MEQESSQATIEPEDAYQNQDNSKNIDEKKSEEIKYSSVAIKPVKSNKMSALSRIKTIQENDWKTWKGPETKHSGRPGTAGLIKSR